jgi:hypothetical protein
MTRFIVARLASLAKSSAICLEDTPGCVLMYAKTTFLSIHLIESAHKGKQISSNMQENEPICCLE